MNKYLYICISYLNNDTWHEHVLYIKNKQYLYFDKPQENFTSDVLIFKHNQTSKQKRFVISILECNINNQIIKVSNKSF